MDIDRFKEQHVRILQIIKRMRDLSRAGIAENAPAIAHEVSQLRARVKVHLSIENDILYPRLQHNPDARVAQMAGAYQEDMKGVAGPFLAFTDRWRVAANIAADPEAFRKGANSVIKRLHQRIQRENTEFYPRVESL